MSGGGAKGKAKRRLVMLAGDGTTDNTCKTFVFENETHTLGNALRFAILQNPQVMFCGYTMPHPSEEKMYLRIQTVEGYTAQDALRQGLTDLKEMCIATKESFKEAVDRHREEQGAN